MKRTKLRGLTDKQILAMFAEVQSVVNRHANAISGIAKLLLKEDTTDDTPQPDTSDDIPNGV
jgi:hypothetical protein